MDTWFWVWASLAAVLSIAEIFTGGFFMLPFGVGAAVAGLANYLGIDLGWQWAIFIGSSAILLALLRSYSHRMRSEPSQRFGGDRLVGQTGVVSEMLDDRRGHGMVRIQREEWRADAPGYEPVAEGERVVVLAVEGTHLLVKPLEATND